MAGPSLPFLELLTREGFAESKAWHRALRLYHTHAANAGRRGVSFKLNFLEWLTIWLSSGHWADRGRLKHQYCMSRHKDSGGYEASNVEIVLRTTNDVERHMLRFGRTSPTAKLSVETVNAIKRDFRNGVRNRDVAIKYAISPGHASQIKHGIAWGWL